MPAGRYPKATWLGDGYTTGGYTSGPWKLVLHTTETSGLPSYNKGRSAPHVTYWPRSRKFYQHIDLNSPARALRDEAGGIATNRDSVLQLEIVCYSDEKVVDAYPNTGRIKVSELSKEALDDIREFCRWAAGEFGIEWKYPSSNRRMTVAEYDKYGGFLGHKHVPENIHWDPGALDHETLFEEEDEMTPEQEAKLDALAAEVAALRVKVNGLPTETWRFGHDAERGIPSPLQYLIRTHAAALGIDLEFDTVALVESIRDGLGDEVATAVGRKLVGTA